ncbi:MAG: cell division ATP-binding protein FtsE, partial [Minisyncoccales bacterium]
MISFENVTKIYHGKKDESIPIVAVKDISFKIGGEEFVSIVGRSGSGKTTLLKLLLAEEKPTEGKVLFNNKNVHELNSSELPDLRRDIGVVFQDYKLLPKKTAYENIAYAMEVIGATEKEIKRDIPEVLKIVGLSHRANHFPAELSGGEKQRVAIARALIHRPQVILADEPTGNLDPYHIADIIKLLKKIYELGTTVILATHDKKVVNSLG